MADRTTTAIPSSRYDDFLFTVIREEPNGTQLSVLSALTRADIDPWEEAARLAAMTEPIATSRLTSILNGVFGTGWSPPQKTLIAARLIARLRSTNNKRGSDSARGSEVDGRALVFLLLWWSFAISTAFVSSYQQSAKTEGVSPPYSSASFLSESADTDAKRKGQPIKRQ